MLEHTDDPGAVLAQLGRALRPGGLLVVEVPNVEATCQSPRSTFHEAHLYNFNDRTLVWLADKAGLQNCALDRSGDGGNLTAIFRPMEGRADAIPQGLMQRNHERVVRVVGAHRPLLHWCSAQPYVRTARRLTRMVAEWLQTRDHCSARERLDRLYAGVVHPSTGAVKAGRRPFWHWVAGAYGAALVLEWLLLDQMLPPGAGDERQRLALYVALQAFVVAGVAWATQIPRTIPQLLKLTTWAAPMFALPAIC